MPAGLAPLDSTDSTPPAPSAGGADKVHPLDRLLAQMQCGSEFPALSNAIREVSGLASSDRENIGRLSNAVMQDFSLSHRLLHLANSSAYRPAGQEPVSTVSRALMILGMDTVRTIALSLLLFENLRSVPRAASLRDEFVRASVACSIARAALGEGTRVGEESGLAAMFHRLGQVMVLHHLPQHAADLQALVTPHQTHLQATRDARRVLGVTYEELGEAVGRSWGFPEVLLQGLQRLDPGAAAPRCSSFESTVRVAAGFAAEVCDLIASGASNSGSALETVTRRYAASLGLKEGALPEVLKKARIRTEQLGQSMGLEVSSTPFGRLMMNLDKSDPRKAAPLSPVPHLKDGQAAEASINDRENPSDSRAAASVLSAAPRGRALTPEELETRRNALAGGLAALSDGLAGRFVLNDFVRSALNTLHQALQCRRVLFAIRDAQGQALTGRFGAGVIAAERLRSFRVMLDDDDNLISVAARKGADLLISDAGAANIASRLPAWHREHYAAGSFLLLPVMINDAPKGLIYADVAQAEGLQIEDASLALVRAIRNQVLMALRQSGAP